SNFTSFTQCFENVARAVVAPEASCRPLADAIAALDSPAETRSPRAHGERPNEIAPAPPWRHSPRACKQRIADADAHDRSRNQPRETHASRAPRAPFLPGIR